MRTWTFCLVLWLLIIAVNVVFFFVTGGGSVEDALVPGWRQVSSKGMPTAAPVPAEPESRAARAARWMQGLSADVSDSAARRWLDDYRALVSDDPEMRLALAPVLYGETAGLNRRSGWGGTGRKRPAKQAAYQVLAPAAVAEAETLRREEPENPLWPILLLHYELDRVVEEMTDRSDSPGIRSWQLYQVGDEAALDRARRLARESRAWTEIESHWRTRWDLETEALAGDDEPSHLVRLSAFALTRIPVSRLTREIARRCDALGYQALRRNDRDEARLWFETIVNTGDALVKDDNSVVRSLTAALELNLGYRALGDWHARGADFGAAQDVHDSASQVRVFVRDYYREMGRSTDPVSLGDVKGFWRMLDATYLVGAAGAGRTICLLAWVLAVILLGVESAKREHGGQTPTAIRWRFTDTLWSAVVAVAPFLILALAITVRPPTAGGAWVKSDALPTILTVMAGTALLVVVLAARRAWQRLREAGVPGRSSRVWWLFLAVVLLLTVGHILGVAPTENRLWPRVQDWDDILVSYGGHFVLLGIVLAAAFVSAVKSYAGHRYPWSVRAARTSFVVRALLVATLVLSLASLAFWPTLQSRSDAYWSAKAAACKHETTTFLGNSNWPSTYFGRPRPQYLRARRAKRRPPLGTTRPRTRPDD